ncbi:hypothetical protein [Halospeciosus flavus]|uniref:Uncharacterized protein n=1 Tax=Halospeciosus flavus TaxID=3032283 RepID=A0ABD5YX99_9EURY|nr:hypothetical protein [Halospeciosus flavus]
MSSPAHSTGSDRVQRTLYDVTARQRIHSFPRGIILRYEPTEALNSFLAGNYHVRWVVINFTDAAKIIRDHGSVHAVLEDWQIPIVTATDPDIDVYARQRDDIRDLLEDIQPAIYIPDAGEVYWKESNQSEEEAKRAQRHGIDFFIERLNFVMSYVEEESLDIGVLPLAKGMYRWHYQRLKDCYERYDFSNYAFYTKQYTNGGNYIRRLENHIQNLIDVMDAENIFIIARHGETHLSRLPPQVTGASGIVQFAKNCKVNGSFHEDLFTDWRERLESVLLDKVTVVQQ